MSMFTFTSQTEGLIQSEKQKELDSILIDIVIYAIFFPTLFCFLIGEFYAFTGKVSSLRNFLIVSFSCWLFFLSKHKSFLWDGVKDMILNLFTRATFIRAIFFLVFLCSALGVFATSDETWYCGRPCFYSLHVRNLSYTVFVALANLALS